MNDVSRAVYDDALFPRGQSAVTSTENANPGLGY